MFYFNLRDGRAGVSDTEGIDLPNLDAAKVHATEVARELMRCTERKKRSWRMEVNDGEGNSVLTLPFATVDPTLDHLQPELRQLIERVSESQRQLAETVFSSDTLVYYERATTARRRGRPYLAARFGQRVDIVPRPGNRK